MRNFAAGLLFGLLFIVLMGSGTVRVTQDGVSWPTLLYCQELIDAINDAGGTKNPPASIDTVLATSPETSIEFDNASIVEDDCDVLASCTAQCLSDVCSGDTRTETVVDAKVMVDSGAKPYCQCTCSDGVIAIITDCA